MKTSNFPMIQLQERKKSKPSLSDYACFAEIIRNRRNLSIRTIKKYFNICVDRNDYAEDEKSAVLKHLINLAQGVAE